ncbi:MAG TPA: hypothetical protein VGG05_22150, partial [Pseudonocardiaceae bacterium]
TSRVKRGMAEMLKGGVIMDVVTPDQATGSAPDGPLWTAAVPAARRLGVWPSLRPNTPRVPRASSAAWPRCSRAASSWTSSPPSRPR